ncbi:MAG: hypothetical protein ACFFBU_00805 [Promethearchaeota archaeon]
MGDWRIRMKSSERVLTDVLDKTGAKMIRPKFINELKEISKTHMMTFEVQSPEGLNKLASSFVVVEYITADNKVHNVTGLFEYAYGALRLVAVDDEKLANASGDDIIAFFETPLQKKTRTSIHVYEAK